MEQSLVVFLVQTQLNELTASLQWKYFMIKYRIVLTLEYRLPWALPSTTTLTPAHQLMSKINKNW